MAQQTKADARTELTNTSDVLALTEGDELTVEYESTYGDRGNTQERTGTVTSRTVFLQPSEGSQHLDVEFLLATEGEAADTKVEVTAAEADSLMVDVETRRRAHDTRTRTGAVTSAQASWSRTSRLGTPASLYTTQEQAQEQEQADSEDEAAHTELVYEDRQALREGEQATLVYDSPYSGTTVEKAVDVVDTTGSVTVETADGTEWGVFGSTIRTTANSRRASGSEAAKNGRTVGYLVDLEQPRLLTDGGSEQKMDYQRVVALIEDEGVNTNQGITEALDSSVGHVGRVLKRWTEEGKLAREKNGHAYEYTVPDEGEQQADTQVQQQAVAAPAPSPGAAASAQEGGDALRAPVDRDYDWDSYVPEQDEVAEYISHNGEKQEIQVELQAIRQWVEQVKTDLEADGDEATPEAITSECRRREQAADQYAPRLPRFMVDGPTGCGKTTLAEFIAAVMGWPVLEIQFTYDMSPAELLGSPQLVGGNTVWEDGGLTKALLASREGPVVLILDEVPRARPEVHSTLMDALDHRARVKLTGRGHEEIQGIPHNLVTVATANLGDEYQHFEMDPAHKRRLGDRHSVDYLGVNYPHREADLVAERTGCPSRLADLLVEVSNQVRERADDATSDVRFGVPTAAIIDWAQKARSLAAHDLDGVEGVENPVVKAGDSTVVRRWYDGNQAEADTVRQIVKDNLDGCPYDEGSLAGWAGEQEYVVCADDCGYSAPVNEAEDEGVLDFMECPDCSSHVERKTSQEMEDEDRL